MPNYKTRSNKNSPKAKSIRRDDCPAESKQKGKKLDAGLPLSDDKELTIAPAGNESIEEFSDSESPTGVDLVVKEPEYKTPVKRSIQADIAGEVEHLDKKPSSEKSGDPKHYVFSLARGGYDVITGETNATLFREEWGQYILDTKVFDTKLQADTFAKTLSPSPPSTPMASINNVDEEQPTPLSASSEAKLSEVIASLQQKKPGNRIVLRYKTNSSSHECIVLLECLNTMGKNQWNVKPEILCDPIKMFATEFPDDPVAQPIIGDDMLAQCFYNVKCHVLRDGTAGSHSPLQVVWVSPDKSREIKYDQYLISTHFTIPVAELTSTDEEEKYILAKLQQFGECFKTVMLSPLFARLHEANCSKESIWKSMNGLGPKKGGYTFQGYMKDAAISVVKCENLNTYVVKDSMDALMTVLWEGRRPTGKKYNN